MVSIIMVTYGHEKFIKQAIEGVLIQQTNFAVELIIANDCSPDSSDTIIKNAIEDAPENITIKYIRHDKNLGMMPNFMWALAIAQGKYIALCEGDDYWTEPLKLQKQVDFLEKNPDYSFTFHKVVAVGTNISEFSIFNNLCEEKEYTIEDLADGNFIHTPTVVFRKNFNKLPDWFEFSPIGDYPLHMLNATYGKIKYFPEKMAAYRVGSGIWSTQSEIFKIVNTMFCLKFLIQYFIDDETIAGKLKRQYQLNVDILQLPFIEKENIIKKFNDYKVYIENRPFKYYIDIIYHKLLKKFKI